LSKKECKEVDRQKAELELLVMDAEEERHKHFDMKEIIKNEKRKGKKKKGNKDIQDDDDDDFEINVNDPRFVALHESHHFAIDPSNPQYPSIKFYRYRYKYKYFISFSSLIIVISNRFKKTKSMSKLLEERQRRQSELSYQKSDSSFEVMELIIIYQVK